MLKRWGHEDGFCRFLLVKVHPPQPQRHSHNLGFVVIVWLTSSSSSFVVALLRCCVVASLRRCVRNRTNQRVLFWVSMLSAFRPVRGSGRWAGSRSRTNPLTHSLTHFLSCTTRWRSASSPPPLCVALRFALLCFGCSVVRLFGCSLLRSLLRSLLSSLLGCLLAWLGLARAQGWCCVSYVTCRSGVRRSAFRRPAGRQPVRACACVRADDAAAARVRRDIVRCSFVSRLLVCPSVGRAGGREGA